MMFMDASRFAVERDAKALPGKRLALPRLPSRHVPTTHSLPTPQSEGKSGHHFHALRNLHATFGLFRCHAITTSFLPEGLT